MSFVRRIEGGQVEGLNVAELLGTTQQGGWLVGIFVGPLDVHFTYVPLGGTVLHAGYKTGQRQGLAATETARLLLGQTVDLLDSSALRDNERYSYAVQSENGPLITVGLIAMGSGLQATTYLEEGQAVRRGNKATFLAEGGLVLVALPENVQPQIKPGQRVRGAETVLAQV